METEIKVSMAEGWDRNTKYFQSIANAHRRYNCIDKLQIGEHITEDKEEIKEEILKFYQQYIQRMNLEDILLI